jgi:hypothetical protein
MGQPNPVLGSTIVEDPEALTHSNVRPTLRQARPIIGRAIVAGSIEDEDRV